MTDITHADLDRLQHSLTAEITRQGYELRIEWRHEMVTHIRWLAGLFIVQLIATIGATAGVVGWMLSHLGHVS
jgi:hypothetical protein